MKKKSRSPFAILFSFLAMAIIAGFTLSKAPTLTPDVNATWHNSVTTAKSYVEFHGGLPSISALSWFGFASTGRFHINKKALLTNFILAAFIGSVVEFGLGGGSGLFVAGAILTLTTIVPILAGPQSSSLKAQGLAFVGVSEEVWATDIAEELFPDNDFMWKAKDDNDKLKGVTVHLPQSGTASRVVKNRNVFPATPKQRVDAILSYDIDTYTTDPVHLELSEEETLSYDKRMSVIEQDLETLKTDTAANLLYAWGVKIAAANNSVRSSGAARAPYLATQTGNRLAVVFADFIKLHMLLDYMKVPQTGRCVLIDPGLRTDLLQIEQITNSLYIGPNETVKTGNLGTAVGFEFIVRSEANRYSNDANPILNAVGALPQATDNLSIMAWHPMFVRRAWGNLATGGMKVFDNPERAEFYGDVISMLVRCGGTQARADGAGIVTLIEAA